MLAAIVSAASLGVISTASIVIYNKSTDIQNEIDIKMRTLADQVNNAQYYNYEIDQKDQERLTGLTNNTADIRKSYMSKDQLNENIITHQLNINNITQSNGMISVSGNDWQSGALQFNSTYDENTSVDPDYLIQRGTGNLKNRLVINAPNEHGSGVNITGAEEISRLLIDTDTGRVTVPTDLKTSKLQLGDKWMLSGVGDEQGNDSWLRLLDKDGKKYYGGIATENSMTTGTSTMNVAQVNQLTSVGIGGPGNSNWVNVKHDSGNIRIGADKQSRGIWSDGANPLNTYVNGKQSMSLDNNTNAVFYGNLNVPNGTITAQKPVIALNGVAINNQVDYGKSRGLNLWGGDDNRYGIWASSSGEGKGMNGVAAGDDLTGVSTRFSTADSAKTGFMFQNSAGKPLASIRGSDGRLNAYGDVNVTNNLNVSGIVNPSGGNYGSINVGGSLSTNKVIIDNQWTLRADEKNDGWLGLYDASGKKHYGGLVTQNSVNIDNSYMNNAQVNNLTSVGTGIGNNNWVNIHKADGNLRFGSDDQSRGIWSDGTRDTNIYTNNKISINIKQDGTVNMPGIVNTGSLNTEILGAPANNYISTDLKDGTNWLTIKRTDGDIKLGTDGNSVRGIINDGDKNFSIYTSSNQRLTITKDGNVGINNPAPKNPLDIPGNINSGSMTTGPIKAGDLTSSSLTTSALTLNGNGTVTGLINAGNLKIANHDVATQSWTNDAGAPKWDNIRNKPDLLGDGVDIWQTSTDNKNRFFFTNNDKTKFGSPNNGYEWDNNTNDRIASLDNSGNFNVIKNVQANASILGNTVGTLNNLATMNKDGLITGTSVHSKGALQVDGNAKINGELYVNGRHRAKGNNGFYFEDHGGGWHMTDNDWIRSVGDKKIYTGGMMLTGTAQAGTIRGTGNAQIDGTLNAGNLQINGHNAATQEWLNATSTPKWANIQGKPNLLGNGVNAWQTSTDGKNRFYFANNDRTYYGSQNGYEWRSATDTNIASIDNAGNFVAAGAIAGAKVTASGAVAGATVSASGAVTGNTVFTSGPVAGATVSASGLVSGATVSASGAVTGNNIRSTGNAQVDGAHNVNGDLTAPTVGRPRSATDWFRINPNNGGNGNNPGTALYNGLAINEGGGLDVGQWNKQPQGQIHTDYIHSRANILVDGSLKAGSKVCIGSTCINESDIIKMIKVDTINCDVSDWGTCSVKCGGGTQTRTVTKAQRGRGTACPELKQVCNTHPCPIDCRVSDWSKCSTACGGGTQTRTITQQPLYGGKVCPALSQECNTQPCPINCTYDWGNGWSACSKTCGGGKQTLNANITKAAQYGGTCPYTNGQEAGSRECNTQPCPINCTYNWGNGWSACSKTCGGGKQTLNANITKAAQHGGTCPYTNGQEVGSQACNTQTCPVNCAYNWGNGWSACSKTCGGGRQAYYANVYQAAQHGGTCPYTNGQEAGSQTCNNHGCPVNCQVSGWSQWSGCSTGCGNGSMSRKRSVTVNAAKGGAGCPHLSESQSCSSSSQCPGGSYMQSCGNCSKPARDGNNDVLQCDCRTINGNWNTTSIYMPWCGNAAVWNNNGNLSCAKPQTAACNRPSGWCTHPGARYTQSDCLGDGISGDHFCNDNSGNRGSIRRSDGCASIWPSAPRGSC